MLGCCPGGNGSNFWTLLLGGDINLSIVMTFVSTIAALGEMFYFVFFILVTINAMVIAVHFFIEFSY